MQGLQKKIISFIMILVMCVSLLSPMGAAEVVAAENSTDTVSYELKVSKDTLETSDKGILDLYPLLKVVKKQNDTETDVTTKKDDITFVSSNTDIAEVSNEGEEKGTITVKDGSVDTTVDITVTWKGNTEAEIASKTVKVSVKKLSVQEIKVNKTVIELNIKDTYNLSDIIEVTPIGSIKDLQYTSDKEEKVSVSDDGVVEAKGVNEDGLAQATITISSKTNPDIRETVTIKVKDIPDSLELNQTAFSMKAMETFQIKDVSLVYASGRKKAIDNSELIFDTRNEKIATVEKDGTVTGVKQDIYPAKTEIIVRYKGDEKITATFEITITKIPVEKLVIENKQPEGTIWKINDTYSLITKIYPENATDQTISFKTSDKDVATVSSSGVIKATGIGEAIITAYSSENSSVLDTFMVKVYQTTFNVVDLGVDGTDTKNDASELNKILKYASLIDETITVNIPDGTYYIGSTLKVYDKTNIVLSDKAVIKRFQKNGNKAMIMNHTDPDGKQTGYSQCSDITITGGTWDGNVTGKYDANCLYFGHAKNITIKDTTVKNNSGAHLIELTGVQNALIENVELYGYVKCTKKGYTAWQSEKEAIQLDYCSAVSAPAMKPYDNTPCDNITIRNCNIHDYMAGIGTHTEGSKASTNIQILNNTFKNITNACINLRKFQNVTISNNTANNCTTFLYASGSQGTLTNNKVTNGTSFKPVDSIGLRAKNGITISNGSNFRIQNNSFLKAKSNGICVWNKSTAVIQDNKIQGNKLYGIRTQGSTVTLKKNSFSKNTKGIYDTYKDAKIKSSDDIRAYYINIKKSYKYQGKSVKPKITIKGLNKKYYKVSYKNYKKPGTATVTIKGKGKVKQTLKIKYKITR